MTGAIGNQLQTAIIARLLAPPDARSFSYKSRDSLSRNGKLWNRWPCCLACMYPPLYPIYGSPFRYPPPLTLVSGSFSLSPVQRRNRGTADSKPALTRRQPQMLPSLVPIPPLISVSVAPTSNPIKLLSLVSDNWQFEDYFSFTPNLALTIIFSAYIFPSPRNPLKSADIRIIYEFLCSASSRCFERHRVTSGWILLEQSLST